MKKKDLRVVALFLALLAYALLLAGCTVIGRGNTTGDGSESSGGAPTGTLGGDITGDTTTQQTENGRLLQSFIDAAYASGGGLTAQDDNAKRLASVWSEIEADALAVMNGAYGQYSAGTLSFERFSALMNSFALIDAAKSTAAELLEKARSVESGRASLATFNGYLAKGKYMKASAEAAKISSQDAASRAEIKRAVEANTEGFKAGITDAVTEFMVRYQIPEGKAYLDGLTGLGIDNYVSDEKERLEKYRAFQEDDLETVTIQETLENIYTHCMIAFPEINFASNATYRKCGDDCLTYYEFTYLLNSLYEKGYIIIDANLLYDPATGKPIKTLELPAGKKPLIFTFDDVTYDSRKMGNGMVDKLIVDEDGYVCTYTKMADGTEVISYDNEHFPVLNAFVRRHPDFTFRGARGTLFFTGFDGILGYRTQSEPVDAAEAALKLDRNAEIEGAKRVLAAMSAEGWTYGSHGYAHAHMSRYSAASFKKDTDMWLEEVGSLVGETQLFCWPYGDHGSGALRKGELHKYLYDSGFRIFFGCGSARYVAQEPDGLGIFTDRKGMTGNVLYYIEMEYKAYLRDYLYLIDPEKMWDPLRLPYRYKPPYKA